MGRKTAGVYPGEDGTWQVDKWYRNTRLRQRGFASFEEAEGWLIRRLEQLRAVEVHGQRPERLFSEAAAHYLVKYQDKVSIVSDTYHLKSVMPTICPSTRCTTAPWRLTSKSAWLPAAPTRP